MSKGAEPPGTRGSAPPGVWGVGGVYSGGSGDRAGVTGCVACGVRAGLATGTGWGARWRIRGRDQGNGMNSVGVWSSMGRAGSILGVPGRRLCAGGYTIAVVCRAMGEVAT